MGDSIGVDEGNGLYFFEKDGFGGGEGEVVLADLYKFLVDLDLFVLIENGSHISKKFIISNSNMWYLSGQPTFVEQYKKHRATNQNYPFFNFVKETVVNGGP